jgi:hydrogenase nickel incorporation protein HypA/HybF
MHEGALTENLFEHVLIHAREAGAKRVTRVKVTIGALSDATSESIEFYFSQLTPGTMVDGAEIEFETKPGKAECPSCGHGFEITEIYAACPNCGNFPVKVISGDGVYLSSLEVETDDGHAGHIHE